MRNLEILLKSIDTLKCLNQDEHITNSCVDEFAKILVVYTSHNRLIIYTYPELTSAQT